MRQDAFEYAYAYLGQKLCVVIHQSLLWGIFVNTDETNAVRTVRYTVFMVTRCCQLFALRVLSGCKQDGHSFVATCGNTQKSVHPPLCQTCKVLCSWVLFCETEVYNMYVHKSHPTNPGQTLVASR